MGQNIGIQTINNYAGNNSRFFNDRVKGFRIIFYTIALIVLQGCAGIYSSVTFEVLEPATVSFPDQVTGIIVLNRAPFSQDMFDKEDIFLLSKEQLYLVDTLVCRNILRGLREVFRQAPVRYFQFPLWTSERRYDTIGLEIPLSKWEVNNLCGKYGGNLIISLEYYRLNVEEYAAYDDTELLNLYHMYVNETKWSLYRYGSPRPYNEYTTHDTLYFLRYESGAYTDNYSSTDRLKAIAFESGFNYGRYLVPSWINVTRPVFRGRENELKTAVKYTNSGRWDLAHDLWEGLLSSEDSTLAAKAAFNLGVFYELEDKLDSARFYVLRSLALDSTDMAGSYLEELDIRILNRREILEQVKE